MANSHPTPDSIATNPSAGHFRWLIVGLSFLITLINYLDRTAISFAIGPLKKEFGLNDSAFGFIAGAFGVGYIAMTLIGGILVDKIGPRKIWSLAASAWSLVTMCLGFASGFGAFIVLRVCLGLAEGPHFPALNRVVADWLPQSERARATALGLMAVPFASVIGAPAISQLIIHLGWRAMFVVLGSLGIIWAILWVIVFRNLPEQSNFVKVEELALIKGHFAGSESPTEKQHYQERAPSKSDWQFLLRNPTLLSNTYAFFSFSYLLYFSVSWLPGYFEHTYQVHLEELGIFLIAPWLTAAILLVLGGYISDFVWNRTKSIRKSRSHLIWICQLLSALCLIPLAIVKPPLTVALILLSLAIGIGLMPNACYYAIICDMVKDRAATALGLMTAFAACAAIIAPALTGMIVTATGSFASAFLALIFFTLTSVVAVLCLQHPDRQAPQTSTSN